MRCADKTLRFREINAEFGLTCKQGKRLRAKLGIRRESGNRFPRSAEDRAKISAGGLRRYARGGK